MGGTDSRPRRPLLLKKPRSTTETAGDQSISGSAFTGSLASGTFASSATLYLSVLPQTPDTDKTGDLAVSLCQVAFETRDCKFRRQDGRSDFGIDTEIEIVEKNSVTGRILKAQVKGQAETKWSSQGYVYISVSITTYNMWKALPVPIIALLCDVKTQSIYWSLPLQRVPKQSADTISLRFERDQSIEKNFERLMSYLRSWFETFSQENILREVPHFHAVFTDLTEEVGWGDACVMLDEETDINCRRFYNHLIQLRLRLGLPCVDLPTIDDWYTRSAATWEETPQLCHGTFSELFLCARPYYEEAIARLREHVNARPPENQELRNLFTQLDGRTPTTVLDPRIESQTDARAFDQRLEKLGFLKYTQAREKT